LAPGRNCLDRVEVIDNDKPVQCFGTTVKSFISQTQKVPTLEIYLTHHALLGNNEGVIS